MLLYTEMIVAQAIVRGDRRYLLEFDPEEHPVALQLGGAEPGLLAEAAAIGAAFGYDEINLNVGCPSDRVQQATFGACLMARPRARRGLRTGDAGGRQACPCHGEVPDRHRRSRRLGVPPRLRERHREAGCRTVIVHARKAILKGLTPKENREVPPLDYARAWRVKQEFPALTVVANGGLRTVPQVTEQLAHVDGVMLGREAYHNPYLLPALHRAIHDDEFETPTVENDRRTDAALCGAAGREGTPLRSITRHMIGLFNGRSGARAWRRALSEGVNRANAIARADRRCAPRG